MGNAKSKDEDPSKDAVPTVTSIPPEPSSPAVTVEDSSPTVPSTVSESSPGGAITTNTSTCPEPSSGDAAGETTLAATIIDMTDHNFTLLTRTKGFKKLSKWAFDICDKDKSGSICKTEIYAGVLMVHLQLAKYVGAAACYPPSCDIVYQLFDAADDDKSGTIDEDEFHQIIIICCAQISSRIVVYYTIIIVLVPIIANNIIKGITEIDEVFGLGASEISKLYFIFAFIEKVLTFGQIATKIVSATLFALLIPMIFDWIDKFSHRAAKKITVIKNKID